jgi:hypothetical protein
MVPRALREPVSGNRFIGGSCCPESAITPIGGERHPVTILKYQIENQHHLFHEKSTGISHVQTKKDITFTRLIMKGVVRQSLLLHFLLS